MINKHTTVMTPEKNIKLELAREIIDNNEEILSALSWYFFSKKRQGRGYLFIHKNISVEHIAGDKFDVIETESIFKNTVYFAKDSELWNTAKESEKNSGQVDEFKILYEAVDDYNPKFEFIVFVGISGVDNESKPVECWFRIKPKTPPYKARLK